MKLAKFLKFLKEWKWTLVLLSFCVIGIPTMAVLGLQSVTWGNEFWPNVFSEFMGMFAGLVFGALFTFVVIDKYIQYHKNSQWKKIKDVTYKSLYFLLSNILLKLNWAFPKEMRVESYVLSEDMETLNDYLPKADFDIFVSALSKSIDGIIEERRSRQADSVDEADFFADEQLHKSLEKFKQHSKADIHSISSLTIPRLLNFSDDPVLLDDVIELEELFTSLMSKIKHASRKNGTINSDVKYIWLLKIQEILNRISDISNSIQKDITID